MRRFEYWYAYFDTIFTKKLPRTDRALVSMIPPTTTPWPQQSQLPQLQQFLLSQKNWSESTCTIDELNQIESDVTNTLLLLQLQKLYILQFWHSKRRVEASFTHLYAMLQLFVGSIIPYQNMTLFQCKAANKLCVRIGSLQALFKGLMRRINSICSFFVDGFFDQEDLILRNFFENFVEFIKIIPKIKKTKMFHVSQLLKYIIIVNPIEIASQPQAPISKPRQIPKLEPNLQKPDQCSPMRRVKSLQKLSNKIKMFNGWILRLVRRSCSCPHSQLRIDDNVEQYAKTRNLLRFIFPTWIRRHSIKHRKESLPKLNISVMDTIKGKSNSEFKLSQSPDQKKQKIRNKSATKSRFHFKSLSLAQHTTQSPSKQSSLKPPTTSTTQKNPQKMPYDEDDESDAIELASATYIKSSSYKEIMGKEEECLWSISCGKLVRNGEGRDGKGDRGEWREEAVRVKEERKLLEELENIVGS